MGSKYETCPHVSAGHIKHEYTVSSAWPMIAQEFESPPEDYVPTRDKVNYVNTKRKRYL